MVHSPYAQERNQHIPTMKTYNLYISGKSINNRFYSLTDEAAEFWQEQLEVEDSTLIHDYFMDKESVEIDEEYDIFEGDDPYDCDTLIEETESFDGILCDLVVEDEESEIFRLALYNEERDEYIPHVDWKDYDFPDFDGPVLLAQEYMKGSVFGGEFECEEFDSTKIKVVLSDDRTGTQTTIVKVLYDGKEIENIYIDQIGRGGNYLIIND